jgi:hypothetical protein
MTVTGFPDYSGVGQLSRAVQAIAESAQPVIGGQTESFSGMIIRQGYEIYIQLQNETTGSFATPVLVEMIWTESVSGMVTGYQRWWIYAGDLTGAHQVTGHGPSNGNKLEVAVSNWHDAAPVVDVTLTVLDVARPYTQHDWRSYYYENSVIPGFTIANQDVPAGQIMMDDNIAVAANGSASYLMPLYSGPAYAWCNTGAADTSLVVNISLSCDQNAGSGGPIFGLASDAAGNINGQPVMPRSQCVFNAYSFSSNPQTVTSDITAAVT